MNLSRGTKVIVDRVGECWSEEFKGESLEGITWILLEDEKTTEIFTIDSDGIRDSIVDIEKQVERGIETDYYEYVEDTE